MRAFWGCSEIKDAYNGESVPDFVAIAIVFARRSLKEGRSMTVGREGEVGDVVVAIVAGCGVRRLGGSGAMGWMR